MTHVPPPLIPTAWLRVSFDAVQIGRQLCWRVIEGQENLFDLYGPFAGELHFPKGFNLRVEVLGYGDPGSLIGFSVVSAALVTVPVSTALHPSPFENYNSAVTLLTDIPPTKEIFIDHRIKRAYGVAASIAPLRVRNEEGAWQLSVILTVQIDIKDSPQPPRVFRLDPEAQVGNGTR